MHPKKQSRMSKNVPLPLIAIVPFQFTVFSSIVGFLIKFPYNLELSFP